jgi:peptidoglycan hydrolase FlgJ
VTPGVGPTGAMLASAGPESQKPKNIEEAAQQFEALLISQMLRSAKESNGDGALSGGDDTTSSTMLDMAHQQFAKLLAANGGLGLAKVIVPALSPRA